MIQLRKGKGQRILRVCTGVRIDTVGHGMIPEPTDRREEVIRVHRRLRATLNNGLLDQLHRILREQLQNPNILSRAARESFPLLEVGAQLVEAGRQFPLGKHEGMIQSGRPTTQNRQIMLGLHDPFVTGVTAGVTSNDPSAGDYLDPIDIRLDRDRLEGPATRNTVTVRIEPHRLVFVHLPGLGNERIEGPRRQSQGRLFILLEQLPDRLCLARHHVIPLGQGARPQVGIQLGQVLHPGNRSSPVPLQIVHAVLYVRFLVAACRHAEPRVKTIVARQGRVPLLHLPLAALQDRRGYRRGVIPPDLPRHTAEERQPLDHPRQNRLCLLARQRHGKAIARVTPCQQQHRDQLPPVRKVHVDVAKVRLQPPARRMGQGDKRLLLDPTHLPDVPPDLVVATRVTVLIPQTTIELRRRVPLLAGGLLIFRQDLLDHHLVGTQPRGRPTLLQSIGTGFTLLQHLPNLPPRMVEAPGHLPNAHPVPMRNPDLTVIFHRQHPFFSVNLGAFFRKPSAYGDHCGGSIFDADFYFPTWVPFTRRFPRPVSESSWLSIRWLSSSKTACKPRYSICSWASGLLFMWE